MTPILTNFYTVLRNNVLNAVGVERTLTQLLGDKDVSRAISLLQNRDEIVDQALLEYNPDYHKVMFRQDKDRQGKKPYISEKLPRSRQRYINEVELFFLLGKPIKWKLANDNEDGETFAKFTSFLRDIRFDTIIRQAKRTAGAETEAAILFHLYQDDNGTAAVKPLVLSRSKGYTLRPLFDQYGNMLAFGYGYSLKAGQRTIEHFDLETPSTIYQAQKANIGWEVIARPNPTGKINVIYIQQDKAWQGAQQRIDREEKLDSGIADTNNYFGDPIAVATVDAIASLPDPDVPGGIIQVSEDGRFEYINPPIASELQANEKRELNTSILFDTFTPDMSFEAMKGLGTLSGEAIKRAMSLGYMKRDNLMEIYDIAVDRAKNLVISIMSKVTDIELADKLAAIEIKHEFSEPFSDDVSARWAAIGKAKSDGIISLEQAVKMMGIADNPEDEIALIRQGQERISVPLENDDAKNTTEQQERYKKSEKKLA